MAVMGENQDIGIVDNLHLIVLRQQVVEKVVILAVPAQGIGKVKTQDRPAEVGSFFWRIAFFFHGSFYCRVIPWKFPALAKHEAPQILPPPGQGMACGPARFPPVCRLVFRSSAKAGRGSRVLRGLLGWAAPHLLLPCPQVNELLEPMAPASQGK